VTDPLPLAQALGRVPSGLFILTVRGEGRDTGALVSWVQQAGFHPPMLTVALRSDRLAAVWVKASGRFTLNQIPAGHKHLLRHFGRGFGPDEPAFNGMEITHEASGGPVLADALGFLDMEVSAHLDSGDHRLFLARVTDGALLQPDVEPMIHVRHSGLHY
jgi:flavin reductase (DIM6/NTAB) family NADH-FMN oxidoreductase RutF